MYCLSVDLPNPPHEIIMSYLYIANLWTYLSSFERTIAIVPFSFRDPIIQNPQETLRKYADRTMCYLAVTIAFWSKMASENIKKCHNGLLKVQDGCYIIVSQCFNSYHISFPNALIMS